MAPPSRTQDRTLSAYVVVACGGRFGERPLLLRVQDLSQGNMSAISSPSAPDRGSSRALRHKLEPAAQRIVQRSFPYWHKRRYPGRASSDARFAIIQRPPCFATPENFGSAIGIESMKHAESNLLDPKLCIANAPTSIRGPTIPTVVSLPDGGEF